MPAYLWTIGAVILTALITVCFVDWIEELIGGPGGWDGEDE